MTTSFFSTCLTLDEVKREYKRLAMLHHPDRGGNTSTMQEINRQYEQIINDPFFGFSKAKPEAQEDFIKFPEIIEQIIRFDITIEVCGNWIWLSGNTIRYREELKKIGFFFAPKKAMWYWRPKDFKSANNRPKDMEYIRSKYGSDVIANQKDKSLKQEEATR
jgi:hypothetical protein